MSLPAAVQRPAVRVPVDGIHVAISACTVETRPCTPHPRPAGASPNHLSRQLPVPIDDRDGIVPRSIEEGSITKRTITQSCALPESRQHEAMQPGDGAAPHAPRLLHPFHDRPQKTDSKIQTTDSSDSIRPLLGIWLTEIYCRHERLVVCENVPIELNVEVGRLEVVLSWVESVRSTCMRNWTSSIFAQKTPVTACPRA